jgi:lysophospholipase L1-like esterase
MTRTEIFAAALYVIACFAACSTDSSDGAGSAGSGGKAQGGSGGKAGSSGGSSGAPGGKAGSAGTSGSGGNGNDSGGEGGDAAGGGANDYSPCPAAGTPCAIMPLGDSITDGYSNSIGGGYRPELFHLALADSKSITFVGSGSNGPDMVDGVPFPKEHEGHSGYTIEDGCGRSGISEIIVDRIGTYHPNIVTLMIGTNDVDTNCNLDTADTRLATLFDKILDADDTLLLVVAQIVPTTDDPENVTVQTFNAKIPPLVEARANVGKHIVSVDMYGAFTANANYKTDFMADKLHPKDAGFNAMADTWYAAIGSLLK